MPLVQAARNNREWLKTVAVLSLGSVLVAALFGAILGAPASLLAGTVGSRRTVSQIMQMALVGTGFLMMAVALGELGLIRRLLPELHFAPASPPPTPDTTARGLYRQAAVVGVSMAASFGIICTQPLYLALLVYVAVVGSAAYGALALGAYGLGLATSVALVGLILRPATRAARFSTWLASRQEAFHLVQGLIFAALGALTVSFFWLRYAIPPS
jgi:cytochrome c biogenesis protein CcdA